tara:strand:+ start:3667 stop:4041 length:375 start_codon:yes stop_codon:yes gene_type:complete
MNFIFRILLIGITSYYIFEPIPWWSIILIPFILGLIFEDNFLSHFLSSFIGTSVAWLFLMLSFDLETQSVLSGKIIDILEISSVNFLIISTSVIGGIVSGLGSLTGVSLKNIIVKKKNLREYRF